MGPLTVLMHSPVAWVGAFGLAIVVVSLHTDLLPRDFWSVGQVILTGILGYSVVVMWRRSRVVDGSGP